jgi:hypothetical protein
MGINLTNTNHILEIVTTGAGAVHVVASFIDDNAGTKTGGSQTTVISSATTTTIVSAPGASIQRSVHHINIQAVAGNTVTVQKDVAATDHVLLGPVILAAEERLEFTGSSGWARDVATSSLSAIADDTFLANISGSTAVPTATALTTLAGAGLIGGANAVLEVGAGTGITVNTNDVAVNQAFDFIWTGDHTFDGGIAFTGSQTETASGTTNITLNDDTSHLFVNTTTAGGAANLNTIAGGYEGRLLFIEHFRTSGSNDLVVNHVVGGCLCPDTAAFTMGHRHGFIARFRGDSWRVLGQTRTQGFALTDGDKGHIVVSASGTVWLWDTTVAITGAQIISTTTDLTLNAGEDFICTAQNDVVINAGDTAGGVAIHAGLTPKTAANDNRVTITADDQVVLEPTVSLRVFTAGVERLEIEADGAWQLAGDAGTAGFVMTCGGASAGPTWSSVALASLASQADDTFLANISGGTAPPTAVALTTLAGAGLTGGADAILAVGAGTGITVNANDVQLTTIADDTFMANVSGGVAVATGKTFASLAGDGLTYDATAHELDVVGSTSIIITSDTVTRAALTGAVAASANSNATLFSGILDNGAAEADRTNLNFIAGTNTTATVTDDAGSDELEIRFNVDDFPLTGLADQAAETFLGNFTAGSATPTARAGASVAGAGLTYTAGGTLAVGAGTGITANADDIAVNYASTTNVLTGTATNVAANPDSIAALWESGADNTDGATITLGEGGCFNLITSTTAITAFVFSTDKAGRRAVIRFNTVRTLTHNGTSLILPTAASISTAVGDICEVQSLGSGNFRVNWYTRANGTALAGTLPTIADDTFLANVSGGAATPTAVALTTLAGAGLTGGADAILAVGAGTGITVNANDVQISTIAAESFFVNGTAGAAVPTAIAGSTVAGAGLTYTTGGILAVGSSTSITVNANDIQRAALTGDITAAANANATAFRSFTAKSILANATNASAVPSDLAGSAAFQHLRVNSANNALEWAVLSLAAFPTMAAGSFLANVTGGTAVPTAHDLATLAGGGLTYTNVTGILAVGAGTGVTVNANDVAVNYATTTNMLTGTATNVAANPDSVAALWESGTDNADGATITLGEGGCFNLITSTTAITAFVFSTDKAGRRAVIRFNTARTLTHNATSLILPTAANITTVAGDQCQIQSLGSGNFRINWYQRADGTPLAGSMTTIADDTFLANVSGGAAVATAKTFTSLAGDSLSYDATGHNIDYIGTTNEVNLNAITGAQGVVDISAMVCGGRLTITAPTGAWSIDGFTAKPEGFWFVVTAASTDFAGTITNSTTATTGIRNPGFVDFTCNRQMSGVFMYGAFGGGTQWLFIPGASNERLLFNGIAWIPFDDHFDEEFYGTPGTFMSAQQLVGKWNWASNGNGVYETLISAASHPGIVQLDTTATSGDTLRAALGGTIGADGTDYASQLVLGDIAFFRVIVRIPSTSSLASANYGIGFANTITNAEIQGTTPNLGGDGLILHKNTGQTVWNFRRETAAAGAISLTARTTALGDWIEVYGINNGGGEWSFVINGTVNASGLSGVSTSALVRPFFFIHQTAAGVRQFDVDKFEFALRYQASRFTP